VDVGVGEHPFQVAIGGNGTAVLRGEQGGIERAAGADAGDLRASRGVDGSDVSARHPAVTNDSDVKLPHVLNEQSGSKGNCQMKERGWKCPRSNDKCPSNEKILKLKCVAAARKFAKRLGVRQSSGAFLLRRSDIRNSLPCRGVIVSIPKRKGTAALQDLAEVRVRDTEVECPPDFPSYSYMLIRDEGWLIFGHED